MQKFWSFIRTLTPEKPQSNTRDLVKNENGANIIIEPNKIAKSFNKYFCSIGKKLAAKINCSKSNDFRDLIVLQ